MNYDPNSLEGRLLGGDPDTIGTVSRWISTVLVDVRFWNLRREWLDLHQEAMTGVLTSLRRGRFDPERDFRSYVMAVARFTLRETARRRRRRGGEHEPLADEVRARGESGPPEAAILRALVLHKAIDRLPQACRDLIRLYFFEQLDAQEISTGLGIPIGTVKSRLFRCLEVIRADLRGKTSGRAAGKRGKLDGPRSQRLRSRAPNAEIDP